MIYIVHNKHRLARWLPRDFEAINPHDAMTIMRAWADRLNFGPLQYEWSSTGCNAYFWRDGIRERFCTIIHKEGD